MRLILEGRELAKLRKVLFFIIRKRFRESAHFFSDDHAYNEWAEEVADEGIGVALHAADWDPSRAKNKGTEALFGLKVWFAYMKARDIAKRDLRGEARHQKACQTSRPPIQKDDFDESLTRLDITKAFPSLSPDQRAAFTLVHFCGMPIAEAAVMMSRSRQALDMLLIRARKVVGESLQATTAPPARAKRGRPRKDQAKRSQTGDEPPLSSRECI